MIAWVNDEVGTTCWDCPNCPFITVHRTSPGRVAR
jgi:Zn-finger protein